MYDVILKNKKKYEGTLWSSNAYGDFIIVEYISRGVVKVRFVVTGYETTTSMGAIRKGGVKDKLTPSVFGVGYVGEGSYKVSYEGVHRRSYKIWIGVLSRCYCPKQQEKTPCYKGCTVAEEWHNFQNFAKWYEDNYTEGYHLDKDIKVEGNRVYGPDTCMFVEPIVNIVKATAKHYKLVDPEGVVTEVYNMKAYCRANNLNSSAMFKVLSGKKDEHRGWTRYEDEDEEVRPTRSMLRSIRSN